MAVSCCNTATRPERASDRGSATIGIQNETNSIGLQYAYNEAVVAPSLAIEFLRPADAPATYFRAPAPITTAPLATCYDSTAGGFRHLLETNGLVRTNVGCPRAAEYPVDVAEQQFQGGYMVWRGDTKEILVTFADQNRWSSFPDTYRGEGEPEIAAPEGLAAPILGFGKVWRERPGLRERLGWALEPQDSFQVAVQEFEKGTMVWTRGTGDWWIRAYYQNGGVAETRDPNPSF